MVLQSMNRPLLPAGKLARRPVEGSRKVPSTDQRDEEGEEVDDEQ
jgi:hypothetical protein